MLSNDGLTWTIDARLPAICSIDHGNLFSLDPANPPFVNVPGDMIYSTIQVSYDTRIQHYSTLQLGFGFALPRDAPSSRGTVRAVNYTSPGATHPAPSVHDYVIYLPAGYPTAARERRSTLCCIFPMAAAVTPMSGQT